MFKENMTIWLSYPDEFLPASNALARVHRLFAIDGHFTAFLFVIHFFVAVFS